MTNMLIRLNRPDQAVEFVKTVNQYECDADLRCGSLMVDAKSLLGVISLAVSRTVELILHTDEECRSLRTELEKFAV